MVLRRLLVIVSTAVLVAALANWWRQRSETTSAADPPEWPPWPDAATTATAPTTTAPTTTAATASAATASAPAWVAGSDGEAPVGYPVKLNESSGIFHVPGGRFYERTNPDRWYATAEAAIADGYRQSKT